MVDRDLITAKAGQVIEHLKRVADKKGERLKDFLGNKNRQQLVAFNIQLAVQNCVDMAAHIIAEAGLGVPGGVNEMFYMLEDQGYLSFELTEKMVHAVGFRNLVVHEYGKIDLKRMYQIASSDINDLNEFLNAIFSKLEIDAGKERG